jgi:anti-sigma B factor antagonist
MRPGELAVEDRPRGDGHTLALAGELDIATAPDLEAMIHSLCADGAGEIVLDIGQVSFVDSSGLRAILSAKSVCDEHGCQLVLTEPHEPVGRLFELTGLFESLSFRRRPAETGENPGG